MKTRVLVLIVGLLLIGINGFAQNGNLLVTGNIRAGGTQTPGYRLDISGGTVAIDNNNYYMVRDTGGAARTVVGINSLNNLIVGASGITGDLLFNTGGLGSAVTVQHNTGKVGIGLTAPELALDIMGNAGQNDGIQITRYSNSWTPGLSLRDSMGTSGSPAVVTSGKFLGFVDFWGLYSYDTAPHFAKGAYIGGVAENTFSSGNHSTYLGFYTASGAGAPAERMRISSIGNVGIGTASPPSTGGGPALAFGQGSNPTGIGANTAGLFAKDVSGTCELFAFDESGNFLQQTPHPSDFLDTLPLEDRPYPWAYSSANAYLGKKINVDMAGLVAAVEMLTGKKFAFVEDIPKRSWEADQEERRLAREEEINTLKQRIAELEAIIASLQGSERDNMIKEKESIVIPPPYQKKQAPKWMRDRGVPEITQ